MAIGFIVVPLFLYVIVMGGFSVLIGAKTTERMGCAMAAGLILPPVALYAGFLMSGR
ncbi:ABC-2 type transporter [Streptomyces laurentii]|uniref:ABC-2 type transporter n=1 Tax=Streptomyces laurentii TaxID=39478 RepID=A0A160P0Y1_STRLU|nr:ABC-2 type transporter [Streptomyces laurentii]